MIITPEQLNILFRSNKNTIELAEALNSVLPKYNINTVNRIAGFLAQCGHESAGFTVLRENLNYSATGLRSVFKRYFPGHSIAEQYARKPEAIGSRVYANRMGNGNEESKDGFKFRGRGAIQLTGKDNYTAFAKSINKSLDETIYYLSTTKGAIESACWFWSTNNINRHCDNDDIVTMTRAINGGVNGLNDRTSYYAKAKKVLKSSFLKINLNQTFKRGDVHNDIKVVQDALGAVADGDFGPTTEKLVKQWQEDNGLLADGIAGPITLKALLG